MRKVYKPGFKFLHANEFVTTVMFTRNIWLAGRLGSGKTALSVCLAFEFLRLGVVDYVWSNFPVRVDLLPPPSEPLLFKTLVIFDEAHETINARDFMNNAREYGAYARKIDSIWLYPSVDSIDKRLRPVKVQRAFRLDFLPWSTWVYRWQLALGDEQAQGWFLLVNPETIFGLYDHRFIPPDDAGILRAWHDTRSKVENVQGGGWSPFGDNVSWGGAS